jgi:hypothetical protein
MAARTMDPATGASTCAFGSHICIENIGSFTINASSRRACPIKLFSSSGSMMEFGVHMFILPDIEYNLQIIVKSGRDATTV